MADTSMRDELVKWLVGDTDDQGDRYMAERLVDAAMSITHECGTQEASLATYKMALDGFINALDAQRRVDFKRLTAEAMAERKAICLCPAATEYDPPCPRHGVLGIGVTGRD